MVTGLLGGTLGGGEVGELIVQAPGSAWHAVTACRGSAVSAGTVHSLAASLLSLS